MLGVVIIKPPKRIHIYLDGKLLIVAGFVLIVEWSRLLLNLFRGKRRSDLVGSKREKERANNHSHIPNGE